MEKKTLVELYEDELKKPTPAKAFVTQIASITCRSEMTVRMWLMGRQSPDELAKRVLAEKLGVDQKVLFPEK